jgi:hypothetical protein
MVCAVWAPSAAAVPAEVTLLATYDNGLVFSASNTNYANTNYANSDFAVGCNYFGGPWIYDAICYGALIYFTLPSEVIGRPVTSAVLRLTVKTLAAEYSTQYELAAASAGWNPATVNWNTQPNHFLANRIYLQPPLVGTVDINVTPIVQAWANGSWTNAGFILNDTDFGDLGVIALRSTIFHSLESYAYTWQRPQLIVDYDAPDPVLPPVVQVSADATQITQGQSTTVRWQSTDAFDCTLRTCPVPTGLCSGSAAITTTGTMVVSPSGSTLYEVSCIGDGGSDADSVTITVPEPGALLGGLAALGALGARSRRRLRDEGGADRRARWGRPCLDPSPGLDRKPARESAA